MILSQLENSERVEFLHPKFKLLFDYIKKNDLLNCELGRILIDGDTLFINNINPTMVDSNMQILEVHRDYIDVHIPLDTAEIIGWKSTNKCYNEYSLYSVADDCALYSDKPSNYITVEPGEFLIVYPEDAHAPIIGEGKIRKLIAKVKIQ